MSVRLMGVLEYSLASASRTSFFTMVSWLLDSPSPLALPLASSEEASETEGERRRRTGMGEGSASGP